MRRWIFKGLKWLGWGLIALVLVAIAANAFDASLSDDAQALARVPANPYPPEQNLYVAMKGFAAPLGGSVIDMGQRQIAEDNRLEALLAADPRSGPSVAQAMSEQPAGPPLVGELKLTCAPLTGPCWTEVEKHADDIRRMVTANAELHRRYVELRRWPAYFETVVPSVSTAPTYSPLAVRNVFLAHTALNLKVGTPEQRHAALADLEADIQVWRRMLIGEGGLISKMVALAYLHADLLLLGDMAADGTVDVSAHAGQIDTLLSTMQAQDWQLRGIGHQEFRMFQSMVLPLKSGTSAWPRDESVGPIEAWFSDRLTQAAGFFLLPNDTSNRSAELWRRMGRVERADNAGYLAERSAFNAWMQAQEHAAATLPIRNPIGRTLVFVAAPAYVGYVDRGRDKEAVHRLVRLAFEMRKAGIGVDAIPAFIASHPEWSTHPATGQPFLWDAQAQRLSVPTLSGEKRRYELHWTASERTAKARAS